MSSLGQDVRFCLDGFFLTTFVKGKTRSFGFHDSFGSYEPWILEDKVNMNVYAFFKDMACLS